MTDESGRPAAPTPWYASLWGLIASEPVAAQGLVQAALVMGEAFGLHLTPAQMASINVLAATVLAFLLRRSVTPLAKLPTPGSVQ